MTGYRNTPPHQRTTTPRPTSTEAAYRTATERQDQTRPRIEQTRPGRDWLDRVERIGSGGR